SISRLAPQIMDADRQQRVQFFRRSYSLYQQNRDLINVGAYQPGSDPEIDLAIKLQPELMNFLAQDMNQAVTLTESYSQLEQLIDNQVGSKTSPAAVANPANGING
ncbi:MAG: flagellum-specific ATP synthase FliI, partial [Gammaproteobacteria bacterium]|nr:flagellum-specific ATP synthase FliI [Gammaproteobacteria bacterium]